MKQRQYISFILSGILLGLSFPPYGLPFLSFIGFVPLLFLLSNSDNIRRKYLQLYFTFFIYHGICNWWISSWRSETDPYLMASGIVVWFAHPFFFMIPFLFFDFIKKRINSTVALLSFPLAWTSFEWLHSLGELSYPWLSLGYSQIQSLAYVQFADIVGVFGVSFVLLMVNVLITLMILNARKFAEKTTITRMFLGTNTKYSIILLILIVIPNIYGFIRINDFDPLKLYKEKDILHVGLIQPNINPWEKWRTDGIEQVYLYKHLQDSLMQFFPNLDLTIWAETAVPGISITVNQQHFYPFLTDWINKNNASLLTGFSEYYIYPKADQAPSTARVWFGDSSRLWEPFNSALLLNPAPYDSKNPQLYRKSRLTPFAERFPYSDKLTFAQSWLKWGVGISAWGIGRGAYPLEINRNGKKALTGNIICIESIYPDFVADFVRKGAQMLTIITNDAWYDHTVGPRQHYLIAAMRAVETRRYIARVGNTGVTGFITPTGRSSQEAEQYKSTAIAGAVYLLDDISLYVKYGDWLPKLSFVLSLVLIIVCAFFFRKDKTKNNNVKE